MKDIEGRLATFRQELAEGPVRVKEAWERGQKIVGTYCLFTPWELIAASGAWAVSLCSTSPVPIAAAEEHLPRNLCPLIKSSYGFALTDSCPYFHFCSLIVGETTCDGKKKMYEYLGRLRPTHIMQLPQTTERPSSLPLWRGELDLLKARLEHAFGVTISDSALQEAIRVKNRERRALDRFFALGRQDPPPLSGLDVLLVSDWLRTRFDREAAVAELEAFTRDIQENYEAGERRIPPGRRRILVTGCPLGKSLEKIIRALEDNGGVVVAFENCGNLKGIDRLVDETRPPLDALAEHYLAIPCSCMSPNDGRLDLIARIVRSYRADGVVDVILQACHTYSVESFRIREFLRSCHDLPYLALETDYFEGDAEQIGTRAGAFLEML